MELATIVLFQLRSVAEELASSAAIEGVAVIHGYQQCPDTYRVSPAGWLGVDEINLCPRSRGQMLLRFLKVFSDPQVI